jgi:uncharacterized DUF497 family protein
VRFESDPAKNEENQRKHGASFEEAREIFDDPLHVAILDGRFNHFEERWLMVGHTKARRSIVVAALWFFDDEQEEVIRIISAREATAHERAQYEER